MPSPLHLPNAELLMVAWLKTLPNIPADKVATSLPGDPTAWAAEGFVQVTTVGGSPAVDVPLRFPVVQVDCWANNLSSAKPPWGKASALVETIIDATYTAVERDLLPFTALVGYYTALLMTVWPVIEPRRVPGDEAGFARVSVDLAMSWVVAA